MLGIGLEWWILYVMMLVGLFLGFAMWWDTEANHHRLEALYRGLDVINGNLEEIIRLLRDKE